MIEDIEIKVEFFGENGLLDNRSIGAGVYEILLIYDNGTIHKDIVLYIGESYSMVSRCANHLYEIAKNPSYLGLKEKYLKDKNMKLVFKVYKSVDIPEEVSSQERDIILREHEMEAVCEEKPITQFDTSDNLRENRVEIVEKVLEECRRDN